MIGRQTMRHACAAVVRQHLEALEAVMPHRGQRVERHFPLAVVAMRVVGGWAARIAVAAQVHQHDREMRGQRGRHAMPDEVRLRMTMQQQERPAVAADAAV